MKKFTRWQRGTGIGVKMGIVALGLLSMIPLVLAQDSQVETDIQPSPANTEEQQSTFALYLDGRTLDGSDNNLAHPEWGEAGRPYVRIGSASYSDGVGEMPAELNPRYISNRLYNDGAENLFSENGLTHWGFVWGQFLDHSFGLRRSGDEQMTFPFAADDPLEEFTNDLGHLPFTRSASAAGSGVTEPREQINTVGSYIDAFAVYGGSSERLDWLRTGPLDGDPTNNEATLLLDADGYLPLAGARGDTGNAPTMELPGALRLNPEAAIIAGDVRANENLGLTAVQTLFAREHNRIVASLPQTLPEEVKFAIARRVVGATQQYITYEQFLPAYGIELARYSGYDATVDPSLSNEFATVGYRAHSIIHGEFEMSADASAYSDNDLADLEAQGVELTLTGTEVEFAVPLNIAFGQPHLLKEIGLEATLLGLGSEAQYANDVLIDNQLRSVLFQIPTPDAQNPAGCLDGQDLPDCYTLVNDLGALDLLRAYDHGMPSYNEMRMAYGLEPVTSFTEITGELTQEFPSDGSVDSRDPLNDPAILDVVALLDANGHIISDSEADGAALPVRAVLRSSLAARLAAIYGSVDEVDAFTGMMAEAHLPGTEFGELQLTMWQREFTALRDGDRFFYLNDPVLEMIESDYGISYRQSLSDVIVNNTGVSASEVPANVFLVTNEDGDLAPSPGNEQVTPYQSEPDAPGLPASEADTAVAESETETDEPRRRRGRGSDGGGHRPPPGR